MLRNKLLLTLCLIFAGIGAYAQTGSLTGRVLNTEGEPMEWTSVQIPKLGIGVSTDKKGEYVVPNIPFGTWEVEVMYLGYNTQKTKLTIGSAKVIKNFTLESSSENLEEVVITGTLKEVRKSESPVPVTIISSKMFQRNVTSNVLDALYQVNGINPQINCNMCNTSDIGINGMQGPYTMILIDGMPIVSSLSSVYGMSGIPNSIINRVEIVKGAASSLYGSEAIGGVINIITKDAQNAPRFFLDYNASTWGELTGNTGFSANMNDNISTIFNIDGYYYNTPKDLDKDGFMDKTLQQRLSFFNKWNFKQKYNKAASISVRYYNEDRHGGELGWDPAHRGFVEYNEYDNDRNSGGYNGDYVLPNGYSIYNEKYAKGFRVPRFLNESDRSEWKKEVSAVHPDAAFAEDMKYQESIYTSRLEIVGRWQLPIKENVTLQASYNQHDQNSAYGTELFMAHQKTAFGQAFWDRQFGAHTLLAGASYRYVWFKDNTIASNNGTKPFETFLPGVFIQDLWKMSAKTSLLLGYRFDYDQTESANGNHQNAVHSPRVAFKYAPDSQNAFRASLGTGYRVVNIFSEDHRALSGQYEATFGENLNPEKSISGTLDYEGRVATEDIGLTYSLGAYYTHFFNKIYPKRDDRNRTLVYYNVDGDEYARNIGASADIALNFNFPLRLTAGVSYNQAELFEYERDDEGNKVGDKIEASDFEFSPRWMGVYSAAYDFTPRFTVDLTGEWKGPMLLPTQGTMETFDAEGKVTGSMTDPRPERSPRFMKMNLQLTYRVGNVEIYGGVKNIFNYIPKNLLVNVDDPFNDRAGVYGGLQFDTEYNYTAQQGRTGYAGIRYRF